VKSLPIILEVEVFLPPSAVLPQFAINEGLHLATEPLREEAVAQAALSALVQSLEAQSDLHKQALRVGRREVQPRALHPISRVVYDFQFVNTFQAKAWTVRVDLVQPLFVDGHGVDNQPDVEVKQEVVEELMHVKDGSSQFYLR